MEKMKNGVLQNTLNALISVSNERLSAKVSLAVVKTADSISNALDGYEKARKLIVESYAKKDEFGAIVNKDVIVAGKPIKEYDFDTDALKTECMIKVGELMNIEVDVDVKYIAEEDIEKEDKLTPAQVGALLIMLKK